jgi:teichuronic acid biosynthesis glycosyltransferase TuaC
MKIAVVTQIFPLREQPYRGHSVYQTVLRLSKWANVSVYSPQAQYPSWLLPKSRTWAKTDLSYSPGQVDAHYFSYPAIPVLSRPLNGLVCAHKLEPLLRQNPPDVILNYWVYPDGFAAMHVGRKLGIPVVVKAIGSDLNQAHDPISSVLIKYVLRRADRVLTVSDHLRRKVIGDGITPTKVIAIPNGCDTAVFCDSDRQKARQELGIAPESDLVLYVGRSDVAKGLRELLEAAASLSRENPRFQLAMVGEGPASEELRQLAQALGVTDRVLFVPACRSHEVARWMTAATLCTLPSYREGCPNVILEALSCGRPVVATTVGGIPELVSDLCAILVPPKDPVALTDGIRDALKRRWDSVEIARRMRRGWEEVARETFDVCASAVREAGSRGVTAMVKPRVAEHG